MFIATALAITLAQASAPHCDQVDTARLSAAIQPFAEADAFRGNVRIECHGEVIFEQSYGLAVEDWQITNTADTHYMLGSISKAYNAALILRLTELSRLDLGVPIGTYLDAFGTSGITLRHLIAHGAGLPGIFTQTQSLADFAGRGVSREARNAAFADYVACLDLTSEPGERYAYSNVGAMLSAVVVEQVLGTTYDAALHTYLLEPSGLEQTGLVDETPPPATPRQWLCPGPGWRRQCASRAMATPPGDRQCPCQRSRHHRLRRCPVCRQHHRLGNNPARNRAIVGRLSLGLALRHADPGKRTSPATILRLRIYTRLLRRTPPHPERGTEHRPARQYRRHVFRGAG
ncbi:MAG: beta-lactamase family protein [Maricaulis sp.]|nr:beta-lactamase family protein [Maricaulis sp.]